MIVKNSPVVVFEWRKMPGISGEGATWYRRLIKSKEFRQWATCDGCAKRPDSKFKSSNRGMYQYARLPVGSPASELDKEPRAEDSRVYCNTRCLCDDLGKTRNQMRYHALHANVGSRREETVQKAKDRRERLRERFEELGMLHGASSLMAAEEGVSRQAMSILLRRAYDGQIPYKTARTLSQGSSK